MILLLGTWRKAFASKRAMFPMSFEVKTDLFLPNKDNYSKVRVFKCMRISTSEILSGWCNCILLAAAPAETLLLYERVKPFFFSLFSGVDAHPETSPAARTRVRK